MMHDLQGWFASCPEFSGDPEGDLRRAGSFCSSGEALLDKQSGEEKHSGEASQARLQMTKTMRKLRIEVLSRYAHVVHDTINQRFDNTPRLAEYVATAAELFPGLLSSKDAIESDRKRSLGQRIGFELAQGVFISMMLKNTKAGEAILDAMRRPTARAVKLLSRYEASGTVRFETLTLERDGTAGRITLQNSSSLNAEDVNLVEDLETAIDLVLLDDETRVGVLRGGKMSHPKYLGRRVFCAGLNLHALRGGQISLIGFMLTRELGLMRKLRVGLSSSAEVSDQSAKFGKPWIGVVESFAIGGGLQMLLNMDFIVAEDRAFVSLPASNEGLVPGLANLRLVRQLGGRDARKLVYSGERYSAADPLFHRICDRVVPPDAIDQEVTAAIGKLETPSVYASRRLIELAEEPEDVFRTHMAEFAVIQGERLHSADVAAKLAASD